MGRSWWLGESGGGRAHGTVRRDGAVSRRAALGGAARGSAAILAGGLLGGLAPGGPWAQAAATRAASGKIVLTFLPAQTFAGNIGGNLWALLQHAGLSGFLEQHPGVEVTLFGNQAYQAGTEAAMLAGTGPDVFSDWVPTPFIQSDMLMDLSPLVKRDNIDLSVFPQGEMGYFSEVALFSPSNTAGLYAIPAYLHTRAIAVNLGLLDQLGLQYPQPDWGIRQWARLWEQTTVRAGAGKKARVGYDESNTSVQAYIMWGFGGEYVDPADPRRAYLTAPGSLAAGEWWWPLVWDGVVGSSSGWTSLSDGSAATTCHTGTDGAQPIEAAQYRGLKWDYFTMPAWPVRRTTYAASDFFAIWSGTKQPELAWELFKWVTVGPVWQKVIMQTGLSGPNQTPLWPDWADIVRAVAPPLRDKNLDVFVQQALHQEPYFGHSFRYAYSQAGNVLTKYNGLLASRKMTVAAAYTQAAKEIDAVETAGAALNAAAVAQQVTYNRYMSKALSSSATVSFPVPPRSGAGAPAKAGVQLVKVGAGGQYTLTGVGAGVNGGEVSATFAGSAQTASRGAFSCRLVSIAAAKGGSLSNGAKVGLIAMSDLSGSPLNVGVEVAMGKGIHAHSVPSVGQFGDQKPITSSNPWGTTSTPGGLLLAPTLLADDTKPAKNYLLHPVWLRLVRKDSNWTAYTSLDGKTWQQAGASMGSPFLGAWVGLYATPHGGNELRAVFDHVTGFAPDTFLEIGPQ